MIILFLFRFDFIIFYSLRNSVIDRKSVLFIKSKTQQKKMNRLFIMTYPVKENVYERIDNFPAELTITSLLLLLLLFIIVRK
jgi:hypothetical protein